jgi:hypothetical protein
MRLHKLIVSNFVLKTDAISEAAEMNEAQVMMAPQPPEREVRPSPSFRRHQSG